VTVRHQRKICMLTERTLLVTSKLTLQSKYSLFPILWQFKPAKQPTRVQQVERKPRWSLGHTHNPYLYRFGLDFRIVVLCITAVLISLQVIAYCDKFTRIVSCLPRLQYKKDMGACPKFWKEPLTVTKESVLWAWLEFLSLLRATNSKLEH